MSCVRMTRGRASWEIGTPADVSWIKDGTATGMTITSAIPPVFRAYATATDPETHDSNNAPTARYTEAVLQHLKAEAPDQAWWLGYLDKPADVVFSEAPGSIYTRRGSTCWSRQGPIRQRLGDQLTGEIPCCPT
jgi:hypothetical protein